MSASIQQNARRVFISYSHDSESHKARVRELAAQLRKDGIDTVLDEDEISPPGGWPRWTEEQIETADYVLIICTPVYLSRMRSADPDGRGLGVFWEATLIYNSLYKASRNHHKFIPVILPGGEISDVPTPLSGVPVYDLRKANEYNVLCRRIRAAQSTSGELTYRMPVRAAGTDFLYSSSQSYATRQTRDQRSRDLLVQRMRIDWIDGFLKHALQGVPRLNLQLSEAPGELAQSHGGSFVASHAAVHPAQAITQVFGSSGGALLILGSAGSGKTILLLELAEALLDHVTRNVDEQIPLVFNLSSWAFNPRPMLEWLVDELQLRYTVPRETAAMWLSDNMIIPLLDGLDEVTADHRDQRVQAINRFRIEHGLTPIVVCVRSEAYHTLRSRLNMYKAVVLQPARRNDIDRALEASGDDLSGLRNGLNADPALGAFLESPLMFAIAATSYRGEAADTLKELSDERERRSRLLARYVDTMFARRSSHAYSKAATLRWLGQLASSMIRAGETTFYLETLDKRWLASAAERVLLGLAFAVTTAAICFSVLGPLFAIVGVGVLVGPNSSDLEVLVGALIGLAVAVASSLFVGLCFALNGALDKYRPVDRLRWSWSELKRTMIIGMGGSLGDNPWAVLSEAVDRAFIPAEITETSRPNEGVRRSARAGVRAWILQGLTFGSVFAVASIALPATGGGTGIDRPRSGDAVATVLSIPVSAMVAGFFFWLDKGGGFWVRHWIVRLIIFIRGRAPLRYVRFLESCCELLYLRRVGGGYMFAHRYVLDYVAEVYGSK